MDAIPEKKPRYFEITLMNVFLCLLVVFFHITAGPTEALSKESWQYAVLMISMRVSVYPVYGFFFLSGLKLMLSRSGSFSYGKYMGKRLLMVFLPYAIWVVVYYAYFSLTYGFPFNVRDLLRHILAGDQVSHFYFIVAVMQFSLLAPLWRLLVKKASPILAIPVSLVIMIIFAANLPNIIGLFSNGGYFPYTDRVFTTYLLYWVAGCYAGLYYDKFKAILRDNRVFLSVIYVAAAFSDAALNYVSQSGRLFIEWIDNVKTLHCIVAIPFYFMVLDGLARRRLLRAESPFGGLIRRVDETSFAIYLSHSLVIFVLDRMLLSVPGMRLSAEYFIRFFVVFTVSIFGCLFWHNYILRGAKALRGRLLGKPGA